MSSVCDAQSLEVLGAGNDLGMALLTGAVGEPGVHLCAVTAALIPARAVSPEAGYQSACIFFKNQSVQLPTQR